MRLRNNKITQLTLEDGLVVKDHDLKANALWLSFKHRLGISECRQILFDLHNLIHHVALPILDEPFTDEEINQALKDMPSDNAPGPDGFNGNFIKKCWHFIEPNFKRLCYQFEMGTLDISSINVSYITLIPKKDTPLTVHD